jgi:hypothetical protein
MAGAPGTENLTDALAESSPDISAMADTISSDLFDEGSGELAAKSDDAASAQSPGSPEGKGDSERPRTPDGKFAPKDAAAPATAQAPAPSGEVTPGPTPAAPPASTDAATGAPLGPLQAPRTWRKDAADAFPNLPPMIQQEILKREQDIFRGIEQYKTHAQVGQVFDDALKSFVPLFQRYNLNPADAAKRALTAHFNLTLSSPATKVEIAKSLLSDYGISLDSLGVSAEGATGQPAMSPLHAQEIEHLRAQLSQVSETTAAMQRRHLEQIHAQIKGDVEKFASDPANLYFNELTEDMEQLIRSGAATDLPSAYEKAIWLNPVVRAKEIARQSTQQSASTGAATAAKVNDAKRATAVNVRTQGHPTGGISEPVGDMDDTIQRTLNAIKARG